jgi:hypothetical protein
MKEADARVEASREVAAALASTPGRVAEVLEGLSAEQLATRREGATFSLAGNVMHLRDIDAEGFAVRVRRILDETRPHLPDVDGARLARERRYDEQPLGSAVEELARGRAATLARLGSLDSTKLGRAATQQGVGDITLFDLLRNWLAHDEEHLAQMRWLRNAVTSR